jgi:nucleoside 2-deoxyribosyltransferase
MIEVAKLVRNAVSEADMIFAWIDSDDCLGTMLEIGMASSLRKPIVVASPEGFDTRETWLARHFACCDMKADSAGDAWRRFWQNSERRPTKQKISSRRAK